MSRHISRYTGAQIDKAVGKTSLVISKSGNNSNLTLSDSIEDKLLVLLDEVESLTFDIQSSWCGMAHIIFESGESAPTITFSDGFIVNGNALTNSHIEINILGDLVLIASVPYE